MAHNFDQMKSMLLHDRQYPHSTHDIKAKCASCAVEVDPEYIYDAFDHGCTNVAMY